MLTKRKILDLPFVYTANEFKLGNQAFIGAGSEREHPVYLVNYNENNIIKISDGPGGMMSLLPVPGKPDQLLSVMGLFPPFIGADAGIYNHKLINGLWTTKKVIPLPFAHRCEILNQKGKNHLFIATVSRHKDNPADWSRPGELHHIEIEDIGQNDSKTEILLNNLFKNHGMIKRINKGVESICISGTEGIFDILPGTNNNWIVNQLFDREVSEFSFFDLDNDGEDDLVTIEPFHGNEICVYKKTSSGWDKQYSSPLSFGHGLSAGIFNNQRIIVAGNRRESEALEMHVVHKSGEIEKIIIEEHAGPTQIKIFHNKDSDFILSANQIKNEVALYY
jgi:hypothetical protein